MRSLSLSLPLARLYLVPPVKSDRWLVRERRESGLLEAAGAAASPRSLSIYTENSIVAVEDYSTAPRDIADFHTLPPAINPSSQRVKSLAGETLSLSIGRANLR